MEQFRLDNGVISITVNAKGAELRSIRKSEGEKEFMWCADPAYWDRTSPVLFPFVGMPKNGAYTHDGVTYEMGQHGFARDQMFEMVSRTEREIWFELRESAQTLARYPFAFRLEIGYRIEGASVEVMWRVSNPSDKQMYFAIGAHPAFYCPPEGIGEKLACSLLLRDAEGNAVESFDNKGVAYAGMARTEYERWESPGGVLALTEHTFDQDTLIIEKDQVKDVSLLDADGNAFVRVTFDAPLVGIWSPSTQAPFVCIEPWYGRCDDTAFEGELKDKAYENALEPGGVFEASYRIEVF